MGKIYDATYKNLIFTPEGDDNILRIIIGSKKVSPTFLKEEAKKPKVENISIVAGELSQDDFDKAIVAIGKCTNKPTVLSFIPITRDDELTCDAYKRYALNFVNSDPREPKRMPNNIFINNALLESKEEIKKRTV